MDLVVELERGCHEKYSMTTVNDPNLMLALLTHYQLHGLVGLPRSNLKQHSSHLSAIWACGTAKIKSKTTHEPPQTSTTYYEPKH